MSDQRFYWIKLKTDFFSQPEVAYLMSQEKGSDYVSLFLKLCLMTANNGGKMIDQIGKITVPYDIAMIVREAKYFSTETVSMAMELFLNLGLVTKLDDGCLKIPMVETMVGFETEWAEKKRAWRQKAIASDAMRTLSDKSIHIREKNIHMPASSDKGVHEGNLSSFPEDGVTHEPSNETKATLVKELRDRFEQLWQLYPRKEGRPAAFKAYSTAIKDGTTDEQIRAGIQRYIDCIRMTQREPEFIKMGSTWFSQHGWDDEYTMTAPRRTSLDDIPRI